MASLKNNRKRGIRKGSSGRQMFTCLLRTLLHLERLQRWDFQKSIWLLGAKQLQKVCFPSPPQMSQVVVPVRGRTHSSWWIQSHARAGNSDTPGTARVTRPRRFCLLSLQAAIGGDHELGFQRCRVPPFLEAVQSNLIGEPRRTGNSRQKRKSPVSCLRSWSRWMRTQYPKHRPLCRRERKWRWPSFTRWIPSPWILRAVLWGFLGPLLLQWGRRGPNWGRGLPSIGLRPLYGAERRVLIS